MKAFELELQSFVIAEDRLNEGIESEWYKEPQPESIPAVVPGTISENIRGFTRGVAWYWVRFSLPYPHDTDMDYILSLGHTEYVAEFWLNGVYAGRFEGAKLFYTLDVTAGMRRKDNLLAIRIVAPGSEPIDGMTAGTVVTRTMGEKNSNYGGLFYPVRLLALPRPHIGDIIMRPDPDTGEVTAEASLWNSGSCAQECMAALCITTQNGETATVSHKAVAVPAGKSTFLISATVVSPKHWDIDSPHLYTASLTLSREGHPLHEKHARFGFRKLVVRDGFFVLNGRRIFLKCAHTTSQWDETMIYKELLGAKLLGLNMVRFIVSPANPIILDICDEIGLMTYVEHPASWHMDKDNPFLEEQMEKHLMSTVKTNINHPSVTIWGLLNEIKDERHYECGKNLLGKLRELDPSRLVLYNSGRFDYDMGMGSLSNPGSCVWEHVWGEESPGLSIVPKPDFEDLEHSHVLGDFHPYPIVPFTDRTIDFLRNYAHNSKPVFISEGGISSLGNQIFNLRKAEELGVPVWSNHILKYSEAIAKPFERDFKKYGLDAVFPFPANLSEQSYALNVRQRLLMFDCLRANPQVAGHSMSTWTEGLCGDGIFLLASGYRQMKPYLADAVSDGFAPLRWCIFLQPTHVYSGRAFIAEVVLANEDVLAPGEYPVCARILSSEHGCVWEKHLTLRVPEKPEGTFAPFSIPVMKESITLRVPDGDYRFAVNMQRGGMPAGGMRDLHVSGQMTLQGAIFDAIGLSSGTLDWLKSNGANTQCDARIVLIGDMPEDDSAWRALYERVSDGATAVFLKPDALLECVENPFDYYEHVPERLPFLNKGKLVYAKNWHFHNQTVIKPCAYTCGFRAGLADDEFFMQGTPHFVFFDQDVPETAACVTVGLPYYPADYGNYRYLCGISLGSWRYGKGKIVLNTYRILEELGRNPAADRLLANIICDGKNKT